MTDDREDFSSFVATVNKGLRSLFLEVRRGISEDDGALYYGLVSAAIYKCMSVYVAADDDTVGMHDRSHNFNTLTLP